MKSLDQKMYGMTILEDLGMKPKGSKPCRFAIFECTKCGQGNERNVQNVKTKKGKETLLCPSCSFLEANTKKTQKLNPQDYKMRIHKDLGRIEGYRYVELSCPSCSKNVKMPAYSELTKSRKVCSKCLNPDRSSDHPLYSIWNTIKARCYNTSRKDYKHYGGIGVTLWDGWIDNPKSFIQWCIENGWHKDLHIDKDIKSKVLGICPPTYSPETVSFISVSENNTEAFGKEVWQYTKDGVFLNSYPSCAKAATSIGKPETARSSIANACRGVSKSSFGYIWKFALSEST